MPDCVNNVLLIMFFSFCCRTLMNVVSVVDSDSQVQFPYLQQFPTKHLTSYIFYECTKLQFKHHHNGLSVNTFCDFFLFLMCHSLHAACSIDFSADVLEPSDGNSVKV